MKLGKAKHNGSNKEIFKIKDGDNIFRILPPMGNLADVGHYSKYYRVCWGYKGTDGKNKPFVSPYQKNYNTQMVEVDCAAVRRNEKLKADKQVLVDKKKELIAAGQEVPQQLLDLITEANKAVMAFNIEAKHHLNAYSKDGKIGLLKIGARAFKALKAQFQALESQGIDALGVENGRFMNLHRTGKGLDTAYAVSELKQQKEVEGIGLVDAPLPHSLDGAIIGRLAAEAFKLDEIYPMPTSEEVAEIVAAHERSEAEGMAAVDRILKKTTPAATTTNASAETTTTQQPVLTQTAEQSVASTQQTATTTDGTVANTTTGEVVADATPTPEATITPTVEATPQVATTTETPVVTTPAAAQSNEDFLAGLGIKKKA